MAVHLKLVWRRSALAAEDVAITTHDFDGANWDAAAVTAVRGLILDWWAGSAPISVHYPASVSLLEGRVYNGYNGDGSPGEVDALMTFGQSGGAADANMLPPQCACSVTEEMLEGDLRRHWGRFYLPAPSRSTVGADGRYTLAFITRVRDATVTWYNAMRVANRKPIVWVSAAGGGAAEVDRIRVDDIVDIQRRRRWDTFVNRVATTLT